MLSNFLVPLHRDGWKFVVLFFVVTVLLGELVWSWLWLVGLVATLWCIYFFRDPPRVTPQRSGLVVSPADGRVISVKPAPEPISGEARTCVSIFMHVGNVHVNRCPIDGEIERIKYIPGKFFNASWDKASTDNERCVYIIKDEDGRSWTVVQIAGLIARRIVSRVEQGDRLARGQRFGLIKFGSRLDVYLPEGYETAVPLGEKVLAGSSVIARKIA